MAVLEQLEPKAVFGWFEQLCAIPHGSGHTDAVSRWLVAFARAHHLPVRQDEMGNVMIWKPAAPGYETAPAVILQGHMDMVCEKAAGCAKNMDTEGLDLAVEGDTVYARGTTLGADDGIAVAMALAVLEDESIPHPALEAIFTVGEETGMTGAAAIDLSGVQGRTLINIDSEVEGVFTVGCAGGGTACITLPISREGFTGETLSVSVSGLTGGHSGIEIHKGRANADVLLGRVLDALQAETAVRLLSVRGGSKDNAIPVAAEAILAVADAEKAASVCRELKRALQAEYAATDSGLSVTCTPAAASETPMDAASTRRVIAYLLCAPNGVQAMSRDVEGLVQTSLNLGILATEADSVRASYCVRSSMNTQKQWIFRRLSALAEALGGTMTLAGVYPAWEYRRQSPLRDKMTELFTAQYGHAPVIEIIHAGVECGLLAEKLPGLDCVSIGPDLTEIHTPRERMHIASVRRTWQLLLSTLQALR